MNTMRQTRFSSRAVLILTAGALFLGFSAGVAAASSAVVERSAGASTNWTAADQEYFLLTAQVVNSEPIPGVAGAARVRLSDGNRTHDAFVRTVEAYQYRWASIRDSFRYNIAAYRMDKMLGLGVVPVTVQRKVDGQMASVTWWPEDGGGLGDAANLAAFRQLVNAPVDATPNLPAAVSNSDYAQAFTPCHDLLEGEVPTAADGMFYERLRALDRHEVAAEMQPLLSKSEIESLWHRRQEILEHHTR